MKYLLINIIICFLLTNCSNRKKIVNNISKNEEDVSLIQSETSIFRDRAALTLIEKIAHSFSSDTLSNMFSYPDYCGGLYITEDKKVVVIILEDTAYYRKIIAKNIDRNDFLIQKGTYSYTSLNSTLQKLVDFYQEETNKNIIQKVGLNYFALDIKNNRILIGLTNISPERIALFKEKIMDSPTFIFVKSHGPAFFE